jgi:cytochrome oxidase Cu insertion factor (SCO1/SenC/PrrC family)
MNGRKGLLIVFGLFVAPVLIAAIIFKMGWFTSGVTNKGEFMAQELTLNWILPEKGADSKWTIFYSIPEHCDDTCNNMLYSLNQGYQALGKLQGKAHPIVVRNSNANITVEQLNKQFSYIQVLEQNNNQQQTLGQLSSDFVYLVDPFGKVVLRYKALAQKQEMIIKTKDWIADLKRLLKYSRTS